ncbi:MAG: diguanylate cyclase [Cyanobacteriota bacterium]|nr:diguanylate cyclase [Cyanobacteriota bacterium]
MARATNATAGHRPRSGEQRPAARLQLVASASVAYAVLALLSGLTGPQDTAMAELWLPAGLCDALALRAGFWAVPIPLVGVLLSHLSAGDSLSPAVAAIALGQASGTALMVVLAPRWMQGLDLFASLRNLLGFLAAAAVTAALATLIPALALPNLRDWSLQGEALGWWGGDLAGAMVMAPVLLSWMGRNAATHWRELKRPEFVLLLLGCIAAGAIADQGAIKVLSLRPQTLLVPLTIWGGLRFSPAAATLANLVLALGMSLLPDQDGQLLALSGSLESQELLELGVTTSLLVGLVVLVISNNRTRTARQLGQLAGSLERTVAERTEQLASANAQLRHLSETDGLTGLINRRHFDVLLRERWRQAAASGDSLALALVDIDHFKLFNDHYGHQGGDHCLQQVAAVLARQRRSGSDCVARYGGEEFVLLWCGVTPQQAAALAERLRQAVADLRLPHAASPTGTWVSLSIGVTAVTPAPQDATAPADALQQQLDALVQQADQGLYAAKAGGRDRVVLG